MIANQAALVAGLGPDRVLKLKFSPDKAIPRLLRDLGIRYRPDDLRQPLQFAASGLPWKPKLPKVDLDRPAALAASEAEDRGERLLALVTDARICLELGREDLALALARSVAELEPTDDRVAPAVAEARSFLEGLREP